MNCYNCDRSIKILITSKVKCEICGDEFKIDSCSIPCVEKSSKCTECKKVKKVKGNLIKI